MLTCTNKSITNIEPDLLKKQLSITHESTVYCFAGRRNEVKGYDRFINFVSKQMELDKNVFALILGPSDSNFTIPVGPNWLDVGWCNNPHDYINVCDFFVLPNKSTYFDLIALEVLSLNKKIILSYTGGNKVFSEYTTDDIYFLDDNNNFNNKCNKNENCKKYNSNIELFEALFDIDKFAINYLKIYEKN